MGLLDFALGKSNPVASYVDANKQAIHGAFSGLASGQNISSGLSNAAQGAAAGGQQDSAYALSLADQQSRLDQIAYERKLQANALQLQTQGRNATADWLEQQANPKVKALAGPVRNGTLSGSDALNLIYKPGQVVGQGDAVLPNPFNIDPTSGAPQTSTPPAVPTSVPAAAAPTPGQSALQDMGMTPSMSSPQDVSNFYGGLNGTQAAAPVSDAPVSVAGPVPASTPAAVQPQGVQPVFTNPSTDPVKMTVPQRQQLAETQGLKPGMDGYANFMLTGRLPSYIVVGNDAQNLGNTPTVGIDPTTGKPDPVQQQAYLATLPPGQAATVKGVINYELDPTKVTSMRGNARQQLIEQAKLADPTFDLSQYPARAAMRKSVTSGKIYDNIASINTTIQHLADLDSQIDKLGNTPYPLVNAVKNAASVQQGHPEVKVLQQDAKAASDELAKLFKGTGASDVKSIEEWHAGFDANGSPEQLHSAVQNAIANLLKGRLDTIDSNYQQVMGKPSDFTILKPAAIAALKKLGIDPSALDPTAASAADQSATPDDNTVQSLLDKYK